MPRIFLIGPPGSGKTETGKILASLLSAEFFDTDLLIEVKHGISVSQIFSDFGEERFRQLEAEQLTALASSPAPHCQVFATGGGLPVFNNNIERLLALGEVVALETELSELVARLVMDDKRPLLANGKDDQPVSDNKEQILIQRLSKLIAERGPVYARARYKIDTTKLEPKQVAEAIVKALNCKCPP